MTTLAEAIEQAAEALKPASETNLLDAQVLMAYLLGKPRSWVLAHLEYPFSVEEEKKLTRALAELNCGTPLPYVIGGWEFYGLEFQLSKDVLIPRPETELLVEKAIGWLNAHPDRRWAADVGTGSGCIAVSLAYHIRDISVMASDISLPALKVARTNAVRHGVRERIHLLKADLLLPANRAYDVICANLPYIPSNTLKNLEVFGHEPSLALDGGADGLTLIRRLLDESPFLIAPGGCMLIEIEASQGIAVKKLAEKTFPGEQIRIWADLAGHQRLVEINMIK